MEDDTGEVKIEPLEEFPILTMDKDEVLQKIEEGNKCRKTGKTNMNEHSSRSHTIFRIIIECADSEVNNSESKHKSYVTQYGSY